MSVSGNEEPGVIARQPSNLAAGIPIKKRRFPLIPPSSPPRELLPSGENESDYEGIHASQGSSMNTSTAADSPAKWDGNKNLLSAKKEEIAADSSISSVEKSVEFSGPKSREASPSIYSSHVDDSDRSEKPFSTEKIANSEVQGSKLGALGATVKNEISSEQVGGDCNLGLSTVSGKIECSLGLKESLLSASGQIKNEGNLKMPDKLDASLSLSLTKERLTENKSSDNSLLNSSVNVLANRSNWDLNTTMDAWEDFALQDTSGINCLHRPSVAHDTKASISSNIVINVCSNKGKQVLGTVKQLSTSSVQAGQQYKPEDSLSLTLGSAFPVLGINQEHTGSSVKVNTRTVVPNSNLQRQVSSYISTKSSVSRIKSEPVDENPKQDSVGKTSCPSGSMEFSPLKRELHERQSTEAIKMSSYIPEKLVEQKSVKSEPTDESNKEASKTADLTLHKPVGNIVQSEEGCSSSQMPPTPPKLCPSKLPSCTELSGIKQVSDQSELPDHAKEASVTNDAIEQERADMLSKSPSLKGKESNISAGEVNSSNAEQMHIDKCQTSRLEQFHELPLDSSANGEGSASDDEKINISTDMLEDDSYGSDYESDGNHAFANQMDMDDRPCTKEEDEYEDGELRESSMQSTGQNLVVEGMEAVSSELVDVVSKNAPPLGPPTDGNLDQSLVDSKESKTEIHEETRNDQNRESVGIISDEKTNELAENRSSLQKLLSYEVASVADEKLPINATGRQTLDPSGRKDVQDSSEKVNPCDIVEDGSHGMVTTVGEAVDETVNESNAAEKPDSSLPKVESSVNENDVGKDSNVGGSKSRIINLPRASNATSPNRTRSVPGRLSSSLGGRERYPDLDGEKLHLRSNRDETYSDGPNRFMRERIQDQSFRNSRLNFPHGRGRIPGRVDSSRTEWDSGRDFRLENYNNSSDYRFNRHKRAPAAADGELECDDYVLSTDGSDLGTSRGGRKPLNDELPSFRRLSSRRLSPGFRDGSVGRGIPMLRRVPRNISPSRCNGEEGSDLVGLRHGEKFMRDLPADIIDPLFSRTQTIYDGPGGQFMRGTRNFSAAHRRGFPRMQSKSPIRSRARSPGPWSSPRRKSDGFNGLTESSEHRSPAMYRVDRIRSPDHACFPEEMVARRRGSPSYMGRPSNDVRDVDSGREHGHPRPIPNRSPADRMFSRSTRRLEVLDPRDRTDGDEYFGGPVHSGRFHELRGEGTNDERRKYGERRGALRSIRPPYNCDNDNFRFHLDDERRPFRFCPEGDTEFIERSNTREREFDPRIKNRSLMASRRVRNIEEQEGNYRHNGQLWHRDGFNDDSRMKRRRF